LLTKLTALLLDGQALALELRPPQQQTWPLDPVPIL